MSTTPPLPTTTEAAAHAAGAIRHVLVLGGGSAGWLTAALLAAEHRAHAPDGLRVTLVESPGTPPIGVGEGTWPSMRDTLRRIGLSETDLVRHCSAAFKQGSRFDGWRTGEAGDHYHHPFTLPAGFGDVDLVRAWQEAGTGQAFADLVCVQPRLCAAGLAPKQAATPEFAAVANYGYHFDAGQFGQLLQRHATEHLGVRHVLADVQAVLSHDNGDIAALQTAQHGPLAADLFVDCSGLAARLLGQHYAVPFLSQQHVLFNDAALALQVPYATPEAPVATQTIATAQPWGWTWDIGLPTRRGMGHVYSTAHASDHAVEAALRRHIAASGGPTDLPAARRIRFTPGYRARFWQHNCVAVGLASGFIEPLEASALALVEMSAAMLSDELPATRAELPAVARRFNDAFGYRWARVIDFLKLHYLLSERSDTTYWSDHRDPASVPDSLAELLPLWRHRAPYRHDLHRVEEVFPAASYQYVLYGMGWPTPVHPAGLARRHDSAAAKRLLHDTATLGRRMAAALPTHRALLQHIQQHGLPRAVHTPP
ncbi:MAG: tryptophan halogenase family protein [Rubrivivax sp.]